MENTENVPAGVASTTKTNKKNSAKSLKGKRDGQIGAPPKDVKFPKTPFTVARAVEMNTDVCELTVRNRITDGVEANGILRLTPVKQSTGVGRPKARFILKENYDVTNKSHVLFGSEPEAAKTKKTATTTKKTRKTKTAPVTIPVTPVPVPPATSPASPVVVPASETQTVATVVASTPAVETVVSPASVTVEAPAAPVPAVA